MMDLFPIAKELVLVGGGHSHVITLKMLAMNPIPGLKVTLISPDILTPYSGMLPGVVAGHYQAEDIHIDLIPLCRFANVRFIQSRVHDIDALNQLVSCENWPDIQYDVLSIDVGITPSLESVPGATEHVLPVKPIGQFLQQWDRYLSRVKDTDIIGVVGAGAGGVELALAVNHRVQQLYSSSSSAKVHLFTADDHILKTYPTNIQNKISALVKDAGITIHVDCRIQAVKSNLLISESGDQFKLDEIFWVTAAASQSWLGDTTLPVDDNGFLRVRETLQVEQYDNIFAAGDVAHVISHPRPKAGVYAVRQGPILYKNIKRLLLDKTLIAFTPQKTFLSLLSIGRKYAVASKYGLSVSGKSVWLWKNWIDTKFMNRFTQLPKMKVKRQSGLLSEFNEQMRCGGCGSKVSADILSEVLSELDLSQGQLDDAAIFSVPTGKLMLHTVDSFKSFIDDPFIFAQIAAHHALSDIYAMGGEGATALVTITVPYGKPRFVKGILKQLLLGAKKIFDSEGLALVGGHTSEGLELSIGFAVNGLVSESELIQKSKLKVGDALVLTKALGTGVLFAADMQFKAKGEWIAAAIASMTLSNKRAAQIIRDAGVVSGTDVTGFGLGGHLTEMLISSKKGATLNLDSLPIMKGASSLFHDQHIKSTLHDANQNALSPMIESSHQSYPFLFDPQTSGGLLVGVSESKKDVLIAQLKAAGYPATACIGYVDEGTGIRLSA
ncbi:MAG: selenide, water dikinase SelD [Pseudomonadales bacterium]|nr:selenide, water dikinase SelD [Pseudomonadales bacterium]